VRSAESALRGPEPYPGTATGGSAGPRGDVPRVLLLGGAPRSGKGSAARRLAERLGYDTVGIDDLVAAVRAVTTVASHTRIHTTTGIDYREYYIQDTAETLCRHAMDAQPPIWPAIESIAQARSCCRR
jgi:2-phosphoglycerate kinase